MDAGKQPIALADAQSYVQNGLYAWTNTTYNPKNPPQFTHVSSDNKTLITIPAVFDTEYFTDTGLSPKAGDRIYVASLIKNYHDLAFALAIQHTKQEIATLYNDTANIQFPVTNPTGAGLVSISLHDVFKSSVINSSISYQDIQSEK